jgi:hypothetical protein
VVARQRVHVDINRQQVVADLNAMVSHMFGEEVRSDSLTHRATVHIGEGQHHGVDRSVGNSCVYQLSSGHDA